MPKRSVQKVIQLKKNNKYSKILLVFIFAYPLLVALDFLFFIGDQKTFFVNFSQMFIDCAIALSLFDFILLIVFYVSLLIRKKWGKILILSILISFIGVSYGITFKVVVEKSQKRAYNEIVRLFSNDSKALNIQIEEGAKVRYDKFKSRFDINEIKLISYSPIKNSYLFLVEPKETKPFYINLLRAFKGDSFYISLPLHEALKEGRFGGVAD